MPRYLVMMKASAQEADEFAADDVAVIGNRAVFAVSRGADSADTGDLISIDLDEHTVYQVQDDGSRVRLERDGTWSTLRERFIARPRTDDQSSRRRV